jgi:hypothetical protein
MQPHLDRERGQAPVSRATGGTMSNRVCSDFVKLTILSMMVLTVGAGGCSGGRGIRIGTTGGATSSTAGTTGVTGGNGGTSEDLTGASYAGTTGATGGTAGTIGATGGRGAMVTSGGTTGTTGGMTGTRGGTGGGGTTLTTSTGGVAGSGGTTNGSGAAATGGTAGALSCAGVNCLALPASCKDIVQDPNACCPTCTDTGCDPCADITCASGTHLETPVGACCPQCVVDPVDPCAQGRQDYAAMRTTLLDKYATLGCNNSSDCVIVPEDNRCVSSCGNLLPSTMSASLEANLTAEANNNCATCSTPIAPSCVSVVPACVNRKCVAANPS